MLWSDGNWVKAVQPLRLRGVWQGVVFYGTLIIACYNPKQNAFEEMFLLTIDKMQ